jgi:hypothetical protein
MAFVAVAETLVGPGAVKVNVACRPVSPSLQVTVAASVTVAVNTEVPTGGHFGPVTSILGGIDVAVVVVVSVTAVVVVASVLGGVVSEGGVVRSGDPVIGVTSGVDPPTAALGGGDPSCDPPLFVGPEPRVPLPFGPLDPLVVSSVPVVGCLV